MEKYSRKCFEKTIKSEEKTILNDSGQKNEILIRKSVKVKIKPVA
jgi:hypothetical protein